MRRRCGGVEKVGGTIRRKAELGFQAAHDGLGPPEIHRVRNNIAVPANARAEHVHVVAVSNDEVVLVAHCRGPFPGNIAGGIIRDLPAIGPEAEDYVRDPLRQARTKGTQGIERRSQRA